MIAILRRMIAANWVFCAVAVGYATAVYGVLGALHLPATASALPGLIVLAGCAFGLAGFEAALRTRLFGGPGASGVLPILRRLVLALPAFPAMALFMAAFGDAKQDIPLARPFYLDPFLWRADRVLFGDDAWRVLQPLIGYPFVTAVLNLLYVFWLILFFLILAHSMITRSNNNRNQFALAFMLTWAALGNLAATVLSSVGPCFYGAFYSDDPYQPLRSYLLDVDRQFPLSSLGVQHALLAGAHSRSHELGMGISAAPSIHVATATLIACYAWRRGGWARYAGLAFLIAIELGSIQLGYHYAIDGILGALGAWAMWRVTGWALRARQGYSVKAPTPAYAT